MPFVEGLKGSKVVSYAGFTILILIGVLSFWSAEGYLRSAEWQLHTDHVIAEIRGLRVAVEMAEATQRGYILTKKIDYLEDYEKAKASIHHTLAVLQDLTKDNTSQKAHLGQIQKLLANRIEMLDGLVELAQKSPLVDVRNRVGRGQGYEVMDQLRDALTESENEERQLLEQRTQTTQEDLRRTTAIVGAGLLLAFLFFFMANRSLRNEIQRRLQAEVELQEANAKALEASNLKSTFLANMSHEIRTPLNGIVGMSKLLEQTELNDRQVDYVDTIKTSSNALLALINEILDLSKIESGKLQLEDANFELGSLLKSTISIVEFSAKSKGLQIATEVAPDVPEFYLGDPLRLRQVLLNLLNNSIKFSERGTILLKVTRESEIDSKATLLFEIIDQGVGLDPATRAKLFQAFTQGDDSTSRRYGGTGLGLAISRQIVEMMNGKIDVESIKGVGSRFYFSVVLKVAKYDDSIQPVSFDKMALKNLRGYILVAEDNKVNQKVVVEMIGLLGCRCKVVENGEMAVAALLKEDFNLVLMDGQMPSVDGYEATRMIRNGLAGDANRRIPIVATTANAIKGDIEKCLEAGMNDYIGKPISYDDLAFKVEKWMIRGKSVIDESALKKLAQLGDKSGKPLVQELIRLFAVDAPKALAEMRKLADEKKYENLSAVAHSMKSSAASLGAMRLRELAERIERAKTDASEQQVSLLLESFDRELKLVLEDLSARA